MKKVFIAPLSVLLLLLLATPVLAWTTLAVQGQCIISTGNISWTITSTKSETNLNTEVSTTADFSQITVIPLNPQTLSATIENQSLNIWVRWQADHKTVTAGSTNACATPVLPSPTTGQHKGRTPRVTPPPTDTTSTTTLINALDDATWASVWIVLLAGLSATIISLIYFDYRKNHRN